MSVLGYYDVVCRSIHGLDGHQRLGLQKTTHSQEQDFRPVSEDIHIALTESDERFPVERGTRQRCCSIPVLLRGQFLPAAYRVDAMPAYHL